MLGALTSFFRPPRFQQEAHDVYVALVAQARNPFFYSDCGVADTIDGRFDMIALHMFLLIHHLRRSDSEDAAEFSRTLQEIFISDMDRSLREMGASDTGIGKRIKKMAQAFYGRIQAYERDFTHTGAFKETLKRNCYRGNLASETHIELLHEYVLATSGTLKQQEANAIISGKVAF